MAEEASDRPVIEDASVLRDGDDLVVSWTLRRPLSLDLHGFYVMLDAAYQLGVKIINGDEAAVFVFDFEAGRNRYEQRFTVSPTHATLRVPLDELPSLHDGSRWRATITEDGSDVESFPPAPAAIG